MTKESIAKSVILNYQSFSVTVAGSILIFVSSTFDKQIEAVGIYLSLLLGLFFSYIHQNAERESRREALLERLQVPASLASDPELFDIYRRISSSLAKIVHLKGSHYRDSAFNRLHSIANDLKALSEGKIVFKGTETWRRPYREILENPAVRHYRSVSWVKSEEYWRDEAGQGSLELGHDLIRQGMLIERILIIRAKLWPEDSGLPNETIQRWIKSQVANGVQIYLVREDSLSNDAELIVDFGIYDEIATGVQKTNHQSKTLQFTFFFGEKDIKDAIARWNKLLLFVRPFPGNQTPEKVGTGHLMPFPNNDKKPTNGSSSIQ